jgi:hypothetical protein
VAVEIVLAGTYPQGSLLRRRTPARLLEDIAAWWRRHAGAFEPRTEIDPNGGEPSLALTLHPAVEPVIFKVPGAGTLTITANTSTGGPGYHRTLVDGLRRMGRELSIDWASGQLVQGLGDETGYFETGDPTAVDEVMLDWARDMAVTVLEQADDGATDFVIGMPPDPVFRTGAFATTSLGPRDRAFFERIVGDRTAGVALFPWWSNGPDAAFYRDRALTRMWSDVRWRAPFDDAEREVLAAVDRDLERAVTAGGAAELPWAAWDEIRVLLGRSRVARPADVDVESDAPAAPIGYRRGPLVTRFADWVMEVHGSLADSVTADGDRVMYDASVNVRVSTHDRSGAATEGTAVEALLAYGLMDGRLVSVVDDEGTVGWASARKLEGDESGFHVLQGLAAAPRALAFVTISHAPARAEWAATAFRTLRWKPERDGAVEGNDATAAGPTWTLDERDRILVQAGLTALLRDRNVPRFVIVERDSWVSSGYIQAIVEPGGSIRAELAGARNDPSMADPERIARAEALGWRPVADDFAGNHSVVCEAPVDLTALSDLIVRTLREVHAMPIGGLRIQVEEAGAPPT